MKYELPDFDTLVRLSKSDPTILDKIKQEASRDLIERSPEHCRARLAGLQFQVNMEVRRSKSPMDGCIRISKMMHNSFDEMRSSLLTTFAEPGAIEESEYIEPRSATVLPFGN